MNFILLALAIALADQVSKRCVERKIQLNSEVEIIKDRVSLHNMRNSGASMGMFSDKPKLLALLTAATLFHTLHQFYNIYKSGALDRAYKISLACITGGAIGNICDRTRYGYVTDFLQIKPYRVIFNIADVFVLLGVVLFTFKRLVQSSGK